jgi:hypothetical protein
MAEPWAPELQKLGQKERDQRLKDELKEQAAADQPADDQPDSGKGK